MHPGFISTQLHAESTWKHPKFGFHAGILHVMLFSRDTGNINQTQMFCHHIQDGNKSFCPEINGRALLQKSESHTCHLTSKKFGSWLSGELVNVGFPAHSKNLRQISIQQSVDNTCHFLHISMKESLPPALFWYCMMWVFPAVVWSLTSPLTTCGISLIPLHDWCYNNAALALSAHPADFPQTPSEILYANTSSRILWDMPLSH